MHILFVCTGNICRSPMAEGIARHRYNDRATFASAGTRAVRGAGPSHAAVVAAAEIDVDITELRASNVTGSIDPEPDKIYVMTRRHLSQVANELPRYADRVELLDAGGDVEDPYGLDIEFYRSTRDRIAAAIDRRAAEWDSTAG